MKRSTSCGVSPRKAVRRTDQLVHIAGLERGVTCIRNDPQVCLGPGAMQVPRTLHGADHIVATLYDDRGDVADPADILDQLIVGTHEAAIDEVMALDAGERRCVLILLELRDIFGVQMQEACGSLP